MESELRFINEPEDSLKCCICLEVARNPKQEEGCGKLFCSDCISEWTSSCPSCRNIPPRYFIDKKSHREIQGLDVKCHNVERGCTWKGTVATLQDHVTNCGFAWLPCPNLCVEDSSVVYLLQKNLKTHLSEQCPRRQYQCVKCGRRDEYRIIIGSHVEECPLQEVKCPNTLCHVSLMRFRVTDHVQYSCKYTEVSCRYASIGCSVKKRRMDVEEHELNIENHFPVAMKKIVELNQIVMGETSASKHTSDPGSQVTFKLPHYSARKRQLDRHTFEPFFTSSTGYKMMLMVYPNGYGDSTGTHISVYIYNLYGPYDNQLKWPLNAVFTVELLNQLEDHGHHSMVINYSTTYREDRSGGSVRGHKDFLELSKLMMDDKTKIQYLMDDVLYFRVTSKALGYKRWLEHTHE